MCHVSAQGRATIVMLLAALAVAGAARASEKPKFILRGHADGVHAMAFFPDGSRLVTASHDKTLCVWDMKTGELVRTLEGHEGPVWCVDVSPDGKLIASGGDDMVIRVWEADTGAIVAQLQGHTRAVRGLGFLPGGRLLSGARRGDGTVRAWDIAAEKELWRLPDDDCVLVMAFNVARDRVAFAGCDGFVKVWDLTARKRLVRFQPQPRATANVIHDLGLSADGSRVYYIGQKVELAAWDVANDEQLPNEPANPPYIHGGFGFRADGLRVVTHEGLLCELPSGVPKLSLQVGASGGNRGNCAALSPDGRWAAVAAGGTLRGDAQWVRRGQTMVLVYEIP